MTETDDQGDQLLAPVLRKGDTIGLVAPAGSWQNEAFERGIRLVSEFGFKTKFARDLCAPNSYLAGSDEHRSRLFYETWHDPEVMAILAVRGGYGSLRMLPSVDFDSIKAQPKIFIGFSDITALHSGLFQKTGLVSFHGPMLTTLDQSDKKSVLAFFNTLTTGFVPPIKAESLEILKPGNAEGQLAGGNLTTATHLIATPYETPWKNKIVFLEDIGEAPYRIDRLLTHLKTAERFRGISGLILGSFTNCGSQEIIWQRVLEIFQDEMFPIWANFPIGHGEQNLIVPFGLEARMDSSQGLLTFDTPCCRLP
ncbi:MAG: LD-carboxypeptidase [Desulfobulbaceae bacterium]|nr:LD-carboxypeptidase [Desulfobulbaceae bacterium]